VNKSRALAGKLSNGKNFQKGRQEYFSLASATFLYISGDTVTLPHGDVWYPDTCVIVWKDTRWCGDRQDWVSYGSSKCILRFSYKKDFRRTNATGLIQSTRMMKWYQGRSNSPAYPKMCFTRTTICADIRWLERKKCCIEGSIRKYLLGGNWALAGEREIFNFLGVSPRRRFLQKSSCLHFAKFRSFGLH